MTAARWRQRDGKTGHTLTTAAHWWLDDGNQAPHGSLMMAHQHDGTAMCDDSTRRVDGMTMGHDDGTMTARRQHESTTAPATTAVQLLHEGRWHTDNTAAQRRHDDATPRTTADGGMTAC